MNYVLFAAVCSVLVSDILIVAFAPQPCSEIVTAVPGDALATNGDPATFIEIVSDVATSTVLISAYTAGGSSQGLVYVYRESTSGVWTEVQKISGNAGLEYFGFNLDIDGDTFIGGAYGYKGIGGAFSSTGGAHIYRETTPGTFTKSATLTHSDAAADETDSCGKSVAIAGAIALMGCPGFNNPYYTQSNDNRGAVYVFQETTPDVWVETSRLMSSDLVPVYQQQFSRTMFYDHLNARLFIGAPGQGSDVPGDVYVFEEVSSGIFTEVQKLSEDVPIMDGKFGDSLAADGTNLVIGGDMEAAYVFSETSPGVWEETTKFNLTDSSKFGYTVGISGTTIVVSDYHDDDGYVFAGCELSSGLCVHYGAVYVFSEISMGNWQEMGKIIVSNPIENSIVGAWFLHIDSQHIYTGGRDTGFWNLYPLEQCDCSGTNAMGWACQHNCQNAGTDDISASFQRCDCLNTNAYGIICQNLCQNGATDYAADNFESCDCTDTNAYGTACELLCDNGGTDYGPGFDSCDCTDTNMFGVSCQSACLNGGIDNGPTFTECDCQTPGTNAHGKSCNKYCFNGVADYSDDSCNCTGSGASGGVCDKDIDDCFSSPCGNGGTCTDFGADLFPNHAHEFNCSCGSDSPYMGLTCEDTLCYSSPCLHGGSCINGEDFACNCTATGYEGEFCQTEVDECASSPCLNDGDCTDSLGFFTCDCTGTGYEGLTCAMDVDDCLSSPCENDGTCQDKGANKFKCTCNEFWEGDVCTEDVDDCILKGYYCENGAGCADDPVNLGDVICTCIVEDGGFTGKYCDVPIEDACVTYNPCFHGGKCILDEITKEMSCDCTDTGYEGDVCDVQVYVSECVSSPCLNEGQCYDPSDEQDDWYCVCIDNYFGDLCDLQACDSNPCQNGGTCTNDNAAYTCTCAENFSGAQCQENEDEQVGGPGSSSSSSSGPAPAADTATGSTDEKEDSSTVIIVVVIVVFLVAIIGGALLFFYKRRSEKYVMPT